MEVLKDAAENIGNDDDNDNDDRKNKEKEMLKSWCYSLEKVLGLDNNDDANNDTNSDTNNDTTTNV